MVFNSMDFANHRTLMVVLINRLGVVKFWLDHGNFSAAGNHLLTSSFPHRHPSSGSKGTLKEILPTTCN